MKFIWEKEDIIPGRVFVESQEAYVMLLVRSNITISNSQAWSVMNLSEGTAYFPLGTKWDFPCSSVEVFVNHLNFLKAIPPEMFNGPLRVDGQSGLTSGKPRKFPYTLATSFSTYSNKEDEE